MYSGLAFTPPYVAARVSGDAEFAICPRVGGEGDDATVMCGIVGKCSCDPISNGADLIAQRDTRYYRGPDDAGVRWSDDRRAGIDLTDIGGRLDGTAVPQTLDGSNRRGRRGLAVLQQ
jgi:hypothetical protein